MPTMHSNPPGPPLDTLPTLQPSTAPPAGPSADGADARSETSPHADRASGDAESVKTAVHGSAAPDRRPSSATEVSPVEGKVASAGNVDEGDQEPAVPAERFENGLVDQTSYMPVKSILIVFASMQLAVLLSFLDQTIVSTALPNISAAFNAGRSSSFVAAAYLLTSSAVQPVWGRLSDVFGRKITLLSCVAIFLVGSLACALAKSMLQLIIFRGLQGVGGGGLLTLVLIIVSDIVSLKDRGKYQGLTEATILVGNGAGPILGGVMAQKLTWNWCFWINLPIGGVAMAVILFFLPLKAVRGSMKQKLLQIDYGGALLSTFATVLVILPLNWGGVSFPWVSGPVLGCLISGIVGYGVFVLYEWRVAKIPIVPPFIFKNQTVSAVFASTFLNGATILTQVYYLPQFYQVVRGDSPIRSGVLILPQLTMTTFTVFVSGQLVARTGEYKPMICVGYALWAIGLGLLSTLDEKTSVARIVGYQILNGAGQGGTLQTSMVAAQAAVARSEMSVVTSVRNFMRSLGGTVFLVIAATILNNTLRSKLSPLGFEQSLISAVIDDPTGIWRSSSREGTTLLELPQAEKDQIISAYVDGFHTLFHVLAGLISGAFVIAVVLIKRHSLSRKDEEALKQKGQDWVQRQKDKKKKGGESAEDDAEKGAAAGRPSVEGAR
ncbi:hypothetical protein JCM9279_001265 [Rhodotorula babjevae]